MGIPKIGYLSGFFFISVLIIVLFNQAPNPDEGIYIIAGLELLNGFPDSYSNWHNGSPYIWSIVSAWMFSIGSLTTVRIFTTFLGALILFLAYKHARNFIPKKDAELNLLMLILFSPFLAFTQIAVYDVLAFLFFMAACVLVPKKSLGSTLLAGIFTGLAICTKYAFIISFPLILMYFVLAHKQKWHLPSILFCTVSASVVLVHNYLVFRNIIPTSYSSYTDNSIKFGFNSFYSLGICLFIFLPFIINYFFVKEKVSLQKEWVWLLSAGLLLWPVFHILTGNPVSAQKHLIYGVVFSAPLLVFNFKKALMLDMKKTLSVASILFLFQYIILYNSWSDLWKANEVLSNNISEESTIISNAGTYRTRFWLFEEMPNVSNQIKNYHELAQAEKNEIAPADFLLWKEVPDSEMQNWLQTRQSGYKKIESYTDFFIGAEDHLPWGFHTIEISVYQKIN